MESGDIGGFTGIGPGHPGALPPGHPHHAQLQPYEDHFDPSGLPPHPVFPNCGKHLPQLQVVLQHHQDDGPVPSKAPLVLQHILCSQTCVDYSTGNYKLFFSFTLSNVLQSEVC